ncbi:MAG TPA: glycosyltransferase [Pyrinomonadaceae bacterium]|nr:glycosyltransferase [Pyrinomonadaceae bacterium]
MNSRNPQSVCIVTPSYLSSTPRVVKEADALWAAGFGVHVVFSQGNLEALRQHDASLLSEKLWTWSTVGWSSARKQERWLYKKSKLRFHLSARLPLLWKTGRFIGHGESRVYKELCELAATSPAQIYIGHYPAGLAAAAYAAEQNSALLGYDAEDLHSAEGTTPQGRKHATRAGIIERRYLSRCVHISTVSELVASELRNRYGIQKPLVLHNVFPLAELQKLDGEIKDRVDKSVPSLYWYSQTLGKGRGIEDVIKATGLLRHRFELHLRGAASDSTKAYFRRLSKTCGVENAVFFHDLVSPDELLSRTCEHDVGLSVDQPITRSRDLAIPNKLFFYLLAGLAVVATSITGQQSVMDECSDVGFVYKPGDYEGLADGLNRLLSDHAALLACKQAARKAAETRWNWETESRKLVKSILIAFQESSQQTDAVLS